MKDRTIIIAILASLLIFCLIKTKLYPKVSEHSSFEIETADISKFNPQAKGYAGIVSDGSYLYFSPIGISQTFHGLVARYHLGTPFDHSFGWEFFDTSQLHPEAKGYGGTIFDGRYIYFIPNYGDGHLSGIIVRYDSLLPFTRKESWSWFDTSKLNNYSKGYWGVVYDGRYIYLIPHHKLGGGYSGLVARFDNRHSLSDSHAWDFFDVSKLNPAAVGFVGGVYDGNYLYLIPNRSGTSYFHGLVTRFDTRKNFGSSSSWEIVDLTRFFTQAHGFGYGIFDGRYMYLAPLFKNDSEFGSVAVRYDSQKKFNAIASWSFYDISNGHPDAKGYVGAVYLNHRIYFVPYRKAFSDSPFMSVSSISNGCSQNDTKGYNDLLVTYSTQLEFTNSSAWTYENLTAVSGNLKGFWTGTGTGNYVYLSPAKTTCTSAANIVVRIKGN